ncbi:hypothetical protein BSIN_0847 [Burkholderia singularis]|uniref:Uncharacterized protein n=1 Tax=Burkholderia singularis TaxID=1503053 RepID=A0A238HB36_9BURK|nr:hypothetical protein BSIN_0847 [Burkholderia singularis]
MGWPTISAPLIGKITLDAELDCIGRAGTPLDERRKRM